MTDQAAEKQPAGIPPGVKPPQDPYGQARMLRAQAAALEEAAPAAGEYVRLKTGEPHASFSFGGTEVGTEWTRVHASLAPGVLRAAADAGVTVTQEG